MLSNSTGNRTVLGRLSKRGNRYLGSLLVQAARAAAQASQMARAAALGHDSRTFNAPAPQRACSGSGQ
ncbi:transposase [Microvirga calopogonii]|uniref:transposase n=1 Tax=Microvirga calopogonii TaxID=2078013 RepID=UPI001FE1D84D|nr:transposase [Microvirga calopogonii]